MASPPGVTEGAPGDEPTGGLLPLLPAWPLDVPAWPPDRAGAGEPVETAAPDLGVDVAGACELAELPEDVQPTMRVAIPIPAMDAARELAAVSLMICKTLPSPLWLNAFRDGTHPGRDIAKTTRHHCGAGSSSGEAEARGFEPRMGSLPNRISSAAP